MSSVAPVPATRPVVRGRVPSASAVASAGWQVALAAGLGALALAAIGLRFGALPALYLAAVTPALVAVDVREHRLPNRLVGPAYLAVAVGAIGEWALGSPPLVPAVAGATTFVFLLVLAVAGGLGAGDVKLGGALGCTAGFAGPMVAVLSPALAFAIGGIVAVALLVAGGRGRRLAFGPYLLLGFWLAIAVSRIAVSLVAGDVT